MTEEKADCSSWERAWERSEKAQLGWLSKMVGASRRVLEVKVCRASDGSSGWRIARRAVEVPRVEGFARWKVSASSDSAGERELWHVDCTRSPV